MQWLKGCTVEETVHVRSRGRLRNDDRTGINLLPNLVVLDRTHYIHVDNICMHSSSNSLSATKNQHMRYDCCIPICVSKQTLAYISLTQIKNKPTNAKYILNVLVPGNEWSVDIPSLGSLLVLGNLLVLGRLEHLRGLGSLWHVRGLGSLWHLRNLGSLRYPRGRRGWRRRNGVWWFVPLVIEA